jgi:predicted Rossmann fold nucleotide-binding protein DprA/Smf involved in DNA uptake
MRGKILRHCKKLLPHTLPGSIQDELSTDCNNIIKQSAYAITTPEDLLQLFNIKQEVVRSENKKLSKQNNSLKEKLLLLSKMQLPFNNKFLMYLHNILLLLRSL